MQIIPLTDTFSQQLNVQLAGQNVQLNIYQKKYTNSVTQLGGAPLIQSMFCDVYVNGAQIIGGVICENLNRIVRDVYLGLIGDFVFFDTQGTNDPISPGLGSRFLLYYLTTSDLSAANLIG